MAQDSSIIAAVMLFGYLTAMAATYGIPNMVSDTYYQLGKKCGWIFSVVLFMTSVLMLSAILASGIGVQCFAFIGLCGLIFVGTAPNYLCKDEYGYHKGFAITAAIGCVAWCLSVNALPTITIAVAYGAYLATTTILKQAAPLFARFHPWYWAEVAAFADVFATFWLSYNPS